MVFLTLCNRWLLNKCRVVGSNLVSGSFFFNFSYFLGSNLNAVEMEPFDPDIQFADPDDLMAQFEGILWGKG